MKKYAKLRLVDFPEVRRLLSIQQGDLNSVVLDFFVNRFKNISK